MFQTEYDIIRFIVGFIFFGLGVLLHYFISSISLGVIISIYLVSYIIMGSNVILKAIQNILKKEIRNLNLKIKFIEIEPKEYD